MRHGGTENTEERSKFFRQTRLGVRTFEDGDEIGQNRLVRSAMNCLWKSKLFVLLFLVGTVFLFSSQAKPGNNLVGLVAGNNDHPKERPSESERGMVELPMNGEARTKGLPV